MTGDEWLRLCFKNWTKAPLQSEPEAWLYRDDFDGFCRWFLGDRKAKTVIIDYLTKGGIPDGWTPQNLDWLVTAHRHHGTTPVLTDRAEWHLRWAALIEDVLETRRGQS